MHDAEIHSGALIFKVRKGPIGIGATIIATIAAVFLVLAGVAATHPDLQFHGRYSLYLNLLPNSLRIVLLVVAGLFFLSVACAVILRLFTSLGVFVIRTDGVLFQSAAGNWFAPWRTIRNVKSVKTALIVEREKELAADALGLTRMWRQARYGCDPNAKALAIGRLTATDGSIIDPQTLAAIIEDRRRGAVQEPAKRSQAAA